MHVLPAMRLPRRSTHQRAFTTAAGAQKQVPFMDHTFEGVAHTGERREGVYTLVTLPYRGDAFRAQLLLPWEGVSPQDALEAYGKNTLKVRGAAPRQGLRRPSAFALRCRPAGRGDGMASPRARQRDARCLRGCANASRH